MIHAAFSRGLARRRGLLAGASVLALVITAPLGAEPFGRRAVTADAAAQAARAAAGTATRNVAATAAATRARAAFAQASAVRQRLDGVQASARAAALAVKTGVPNGIGAGGLLASNGTGLWTGAATPVSSAAGDRTTVTVAQTQDKAILNWDSFNVGRETDLVFNQKGNTNWVALNRVTSTNADPSKILGTIKADGSVYILNRNGIIFGGASQVNTRSLIASTAGITDIQFTQRGIYSTDANRLPTFTDARGKVTVEAGARLTTSKPATVVEGGGFVLLMGSTVENAGIITSALGQTALAAGDDFVVRAGYNTENNLASTTRGNEIAVDIDADTRDADDNIVRSTSGTVTNSGIIEAREGDITLAGRTVLQSGYALSTTTVATRGTIHLLTNVSDTLASVTLGANSVTLVLPDLDSKATATNAQRNALLGSGANGVFRIWKLNNQGLGNLDYRLSDRLDQGRVEIVSGSTVEFGDSSLTMVPGGQIAVRAAARVAVGKGATLDVSGSQGVTLAVESNSLKVNIQPYELRDSPLNREGENLNNNDVYVDIRDLVLVPGGTGGVAGDRYYTAGGLIEVSGYLGNTTHGIGEWSAQGGTINVYSKEIVAQREAVFNIGGGSVNYLAGTTRTTQLLGADGKLYDIGHAPAGMKMMAIGDAFVVKHARYGDRYTEVYADSFTRTTRFRNETGYTVGRDAGTLTLSAPSVVFEAQIVADVAAGEYQTAARPDLPIVVSLPGTATGTLAPRLDGYALTQTVVPLAGALALGNSPAGNSMLEPVERLPRFENDVVFGVGTDTAGSIGIGDALKTEQVGKVSLSSASLNTTGLGGLTAVAGSIRIADALVLANGGQTTMQATTIDVEANVTAHSGTIALQARPVALDGTVASRLTVADGVKIDATGLWTNLLLDPTGARDRLAHVAGGDIILSSARGALSLGKASLVDASAGGAILEDGANIGAKGGNIAIMVGQFGGERNPLTLGGTLQSYGSGNKTGGTLTLTAGQTITFGGGLTRIDGELQAGEVALGNFFTANAIEVAVGDKLPFDYSVLITSIAPGALLTEDTVLDFAEVTTSEPWILPDGFMAYDADFNEYYAGDILPAGNGYVIGTLLAGTALPVELFPNGLAITPYVVSLKAGEIAPQAITFAAGTKIDKGRTLDAAFKIEKPLELSSGLLQQGFAQYDIQSNGGDLIVAPGMTLDVAAPVRRFTAASNGVATGLAGGLELWLPPEVQLDDAGGKVIARAGAGLRLVGAGLTLNKALDGYGRETVPLVSGDLTLGAGATIRVDDGQSVELRSGDSITVDGRVVAHGGKITLASTASENVDRGDGVAPEPPSYDAGRSIWLSAGSVLDVSGRAVTGVDRDGLRYGTVGAGGSIRLGGAISTSGQGRPVDGSTSAFVIVRPGARLDASGASATIDLATDALGGGSRPLTIATDGGSLSFDSQWGIFLDGDMRAAAGGAGASGGTLSVTLATPYLPQLGVATDQQAPDFMRTLRTITVDRTHVPLLPADLQQGACFTACWTPGQTSAEAKLSNDGMPDYLNTADIGVDQVAAGGFSNLSLSTGDVISLGAGVDLKLSGNLSLNGAIVNADADAATRLGAAYVKLSRSAASSINIVRRDTGSDVSTEVPLVGDGSLTITGGLIDIASTQFGMTGGIGLSDGRLKTFNLASPGDVQLVSGGDIRLTGGTIASLSNLTLTAAQIYPVTGAVATISAGLYRYRFPGNTSGYTTLVPGGTVTFKGLGGAAPAAPLSIYGKVTVIADVINQGGVLRAPLGSIQLGDGGDKYAPGIDQIEPGQLYWEQSNVTTSQVNLLAGSLTSVSAKGLVVPYGGTTDGLTWTLNGAPLTTTLAGQGVTLVGAVDVDKGATLDLSGGGTPAGVGFIAGRGGSADVLQNALADLNPGFAGVSKSSNTVYAIVPSYQGSYAPTALSGNDQPALGGQITLATDVAGLKAGTYMLLPAEYALLDGGVRVELGGSALPGAAPAALGEGSFRVGVTTSIANTSVVSSLPVAAILTPGKVVRTYSQYNETSFAKFLVETPNVAQFGNPPTLLPQDGKLLTLALVNPVDKTKPVFSFEGTGLFAADTGGHGGVLSVVSPRYYDDNFRLEILGAGGIATDGYVSMFASDLNAVGAALMVLGGSATPSLPLDRIAPTVLIGSGTFSANAGTREIVVRGGANLSAAQIMLVTNDFGNISVENGAVLSSIGKGAGAYDSASGYGFAPNTFQTASGNILTISNGLVEFRGIIGTSSGLIDIAEGASLLTEGTIAFSTKGNVRISENAVYGGRYIGFSTSAINIGTTETLAAAGAAGLVPGGIAFNQGVLDRLLDGSGGAGVPKLERLMLTAQQSINFYGGVDLDTIDPATGKSKVQLVLSTPAIYGFGSATDAATIRTDTLVWNGVVGTRSAAFSQGIPTSATPGGIVAGGAGTGSGTLNLIADTLVLGYQAGSQVNGLVALDRVALGFGTVNLTASNRIVSNSTGTLSVYQSQGEFGKAGSGGTLNLTAPMVTGAAASVMTYTSGGAMTLAGTAAASTADAALGAEIRLNAASIVANTAIALPSGKLLMTAAGDIVLGAGAKLDMAGNEVTFFDEKRYSFGGDIVIESTAGSITQAAGSTIDLGARYNDAGLLKLTALGGTVDLAGTIKGAATSDVANAVLRQGGIDIRAGVIADFTGLNQRLTTGGITETRAFLTKTGSLTIGDEVKARNISITADGGSLTVVGRIDASGQRPGTIRLAAQGDLTLAASAVLDTRGSLLEVDGYGAAVEATNRGHVALATAAGTLTLASGATIDMTSPDGVARGQVELSAPRIGGNDIAIAAAGPLAIRGADSISVNGYRSYEPADGVVDQALLDEAHADSTAFINAALVNGGLMARLGGLTAYSQAFHLRPGVELRSVAGGNLNVTGDLNLAGYRYASLNPRSQQTAVYGSGEVGRLSVRAANDLSVYGSITDGFETPAATPDDDGWLLYSGAQDFNSRTAPGEYRLPAAVTLAAGTTFRTSGTLSFDAAIGAAQVYGNAVAPVAVTLAEDYTLTSDWTASADIALAGGGTIRRGSIILAGTVLAADTVLSAGSVLPTSYAAQAMTVAKGTDLSFLVDRATTTAATLLVAGDIIPDLANIRLDGGVGSVNLRPSGSGRIWGAAAMLAPGSQSWSMDLVSGADLASADRLGLQAKTRLGAAGLTGDITLSDRHYGVGVTAIQAAQSFSVLRTGTGTLNLVAGGDYEQHSLFGVYTAGTQSATIGGTTADGYNVYNQPRAVMVNPDGSPAPVLGTDAADYGAAVAAYQAWYPEHGGDMTLSAQGDVRGYSLATNASTSRRATAAIGNWLWRQGAYGIAGEDVPTAWWINFGTYIPVSFSVFQPPYAVLTGFTGMGTLGGGNVTVTAGGNAGMTGTRVSGFDDLGSLASTGLNIAVGGTGRVTSVTSTDGIVTGGTLVQTGGGDLNVRVGGALNPAGNVNPNSARNTSTDLAGLFTNLRGDIDIVAGAVGRSVTIYGRDFVDPRQSGALYSANSSSGGGIVVAPADGIVTVTTRGDLVLGGTADPGRVDQLGTGVGHTVAAGSFLRTDADGNLVRMAGDVALSGFSLWRPDTEIDLFAAGGNLNPILTAASGSDDTVDLRHWYPAILKAVAATGNIYLVPTGSINMTSGSIPLELAPSIFGRMELLAGDSLLSDGGQTARDDNGVYYAVGLPLAISGMAADVNSVSNPFKPAWRTQVNGLGDPAFDRPVLTNTRLDENGIAVNTLSMLAFQADNATGQLGARASSLFYAAGGDINQLNIGFINYTNLNATYVGAGPAEIRAGRDIVNLGTSPVIGCGFGGPVDCRTSVSMFGPASKGGLIVHSAPTDISVISAGRDIIYANMTVAGPGNLVVEAGRNIYQGDQGSFTSVGPLFGLTPATRNGGAAITVMTGAGAGGPNYAALVDRYLDPANLADPVRPLAEQPGRAVKTYGIELAEWLKTRFGFEGADALGFFAALPEEQRNVFARQVYFAELKAGGREYNDPDSSRFNSYLRGREMIATLFPDKNAAGEAMSYAGDLTMLGGSNIRTLFGGNIEIMVAGGQALIGVGGVVPPATAGVVSLGSGNIDVFTQDSILLGQSRVFTTFGGDIFMWSIKGDINAGRGSKSTVVYQPPRRVYDSYGNVTLSPPTSNTGAGIATLNPIPEIAPGDIDLIAPLGTIDAGEAGIRVSGNINLAALQVINAANIAVQGDAAGIPVIAAVNTGALTAASSASAVAVSQATRIAERAKPMPVRNIPAIVTVTFVGFGDQ